MFARDDVAGNRRQREKVPWAELRARLRKVAGVFKTSVSAGRYSVVAGPLFADDSETASVWAAIRDDIASDANANVDFHPFPEGTPRLFYNTPWKRALRDKYAVFKANMGGVLDALDAGQAGVTTLSEGVTAVNVVLPKPLMSLAPRKLVERTLYLVRNQNNYAIFDDTAVRITPWRDREGMHDFCNIPNTLNLIIEAEDVEKEEDVLSQMKWHEVQKENPGVTAAVYVGVALERGGPNSGMRRGAAGESGVLRLAVQRDHAGFQNRGRRGLRAFRRAERTIFVYKIFRVFSGE